MTLSKLAGLSALAITAVSGFASAQQQQLQLPPGRVYAFHSGAQSGCPPMDWHIVLQEGGVLTGMISWTTCNRSRGRQELSIVRRGNLR